MSSTAEVGRHFDERAARYDNWVSNFAGEQELRVVRKFVPAGSKVLDYGCGTGRTTLDLLRRGCEVTGYDLSPEMLARAKVKAEEQGYEAELTADPAQLVGRTWPVVACIGVLDYAPNPSPLLRTLRSHVAPGGRLVVTHPNATSVLGWTYIVASRWTVPAYARTPWFAERAAVSAGLRVERLGFAFPPLRGLGHTVVLSLRPAE
jgi:2-polyprenyl-3-methyl-5-hydroxy-6-metoxy-1,4-benzoquinol methylase